MEYLKQNAELEPSQLPPEGASSSKPRPIIQTQDLGKQYGSTWAIRELNLAIHPGEVYGLLGPNGAGKTTSLRMIAGLLQPDTGSVHIAGQAMGPELFQNKKKVGFLTGNTHLYERLTPVEVLRFFGQLHTLPKQRIEERIAYWSDALELHSFRDRPCGTLSTGQSQRVNIARTLLHEPDVVILDEPTSGLDIISAEFILNIVRTCQKEGRAVLLSTHILAEIELLCDRIGIIHQGRMLAEGSLDELLEGSQTQRLSEAFLQIIRTSSVASS